MFYVVLLQLMCHSRLPSTSTPEMIVLEGKSILEGQNVNWHPTNLAWLNIRTNERILDLDVQLSPILNLIRSSLSTEQRGCFFEESKAQYFSVNVPLY